MTPARPADDALADVVAVVVERLGAGRDRVQVRGDAVVVLALDGRRRALTPPVFVRDLVAALQHR